MCCCCVCSNQSAAKRCTEVKFGQNSLFFSLSLSLALLLPFSLSLSLFSSVSQPSCSERASKRSRDDARVVDVVRNSLNSSISISPILSFFSKEKKTFFAKSKNRLRIKKLFLVIDREQHQDSQNFLGQFHQIFVIFDLKSQDLKH